MGAEFPRPRLTTMAVLPSRNTPASKRGSSDRSGPNSPPRNGSRQSPPWPWPQSTAWTPRSAHFVRSPFRWASIRMQTSGPRAARSSAVSASGVFLS